MFTRTGWFVSALGTVLLIAGAFLRYRELVVVALVLLGCVVAALLSSFRRPQLDIRRDIIPQRVSEGEGSATILNATNIAKRRSPPVVTIDNVAGQRHTVPIPALAPGERHVVSASVPTDRRGIYPVGPLVISRSDPFNLVQVAQGEVEKTELIVHPRTVRVSPLPTGRSQELEGPAQAGAPRGGVAFHSLREYAAGDDLRLIHWRSTARVGELMVRHTVVTNEPRLFIVLDTARASYDDPNDFEEAVRITASMIAAGTEMRFPTTFHTTNGVMRKIDPTGQGKVNLFDALAGLRLTEEDPGLTALNQLVTRREHGVSLGVVTGLPVRERVAVVGRVAGRYEMSTLVHVGNYLKHPPIGVAGLLTISVETVEQFASVWKTRVG
jgi:uncharacterized protein (DUF58 family)